MNLTYNYYIIYHKILQKISKGLILVSGPTKSGKSKWAESLLLNYQDVLYIATSEPRPNDEDWVKRIEKHKQRRPSNWKIIEYPDDICLSLTSVSNNIPILIDSLGGFVSQHLNSSDQEWANISCNLINQFKLIDNLIVLVEEETGWGVVPSTKLGNNFRERICDLSSKLNKVAAQNWLIYKDRAINIDDIGIKLISDEY